MFERYTEAARRTLFFARYEVSQLGAIEIGSEHLLLGLLREANGLVGRLLAASKVSLESIRRDIEQGAEARPPVSTSIEIPFGGETQAVLRAAAEEADRLGDAHIGNEHLLLGLLRIPHSRAAAVLANHGVRLDDLRQQLVAVRGNSPGAAHWVTVTDVPEQIERLEHSVRQLMTAVPDDATSVLAQRLLDSLDAFKRHLTGTDRE